MIVFFLFLYCLIRIKYLLPSEPYIMVVFDAINCLLQIPGSLSAQSNINPRDSVEMIEQSEECSVSATKSKKLSVTSTAAKETSHASCGPLVQATISTLFKKVEKKVSVINICLMSESSLPRS